VKDGTVTLYANWTANTYTLNFNPNGGSVTPSSKTVTYDSPYGELPIPTRDGYTFNGWTQNIGGGTVYTEESIVKSDNEHTFFAQWKKIENPPTPNNKPNVVNPPAKTTYQVTFSPNGGSGSMDVQKFNEGESKPLTANDFVRDGYEFKGWAVISGGDVVFGDGESVVIDKTMTLYAVWEEIPDTPTEEPEEPTDEPKTQLSQMIIPGLFLLILITLILATVVRIVTRRRK